MGRFLHGLARMFTVPRSVRAQIDANPLTLVAKSLLLSDLGAAISQAVDKNIKDPALAAAAKQEIGAMLDHTGILK